MEYTGMVHALEEIHRLVKPTGILIDIHPVAEPSPIEIHQGEKIEPVGDLSIRQWCSDYQHADEALIEIKQRGLFMVEREGMFNSLTYYDTVAEMRTDWKEAIDKFARDAQSIDESMPHAEAMAERAEELMQAAANGAELVVGERVHISRLKPRFP
jgi:predicted RNase H-like HicB family nuclease